MCHISSVALILVFAQTSAEPRLGPNATKENRASIAKLLLEAGIAELEGMVFRTTKSQDVKAKKFGVEVKLGTASATAEATLSDPKRNLSVEVQELRRKSKLEVRGKCTASCPFSGKASGKVLGVPFSVPFTATATVVATADVKFRTNAEGKLLLEPAFVDWTGTVSNVRFGDKFADAVFGGLAQNAVNNWLADNKGSLTIHANSTLQKAADDGKLTANPDGLFK